MGTLDRICNPKKFWSQGRILLNPRLPKGGGVVTTPQMVCLRFHQNGKQSDCGHLRNLFYILSGHFDEKNPGVPPNMGVG